MEEQDDQNSPQPLIMRSYRRHRRQAKWGTRSLFIPLATFLWGIFWYLMMKQPSLPDGAATDNTSSWLALLIGATVIQAAGIAMAIMGLLDPDHKHGHAATGLATNAFVFLAAMIVLALRIFSQSVG